MIAGGGGFRVPLVYRALCEGPFAGLVRELVLYDVDPGRLAAINAVLASFAGQHPPGARHVSRRPRHHLPGRGAARHGHGVRRDPARRDSRPHRRRAGGPGSGAPGPGNHRGRRHLLRAAVHPAHAGARAQMRRHCPDAWLLNFTNPAGMVTEALVPVLGRKVVGICDSASGLVHRAARAAGVAAAGGHARRRGLLRPEPPRLAVPAGGRRPGRAARAAGRRGRPGRFRGGTAVPAALPGESGVPAERIPVLLLRDRTAPWPASGPPPRPAASPSTGSSPSSIRGSRRPARRPTGCGTPPAGPARRATSPRPAPPASAGTRRTWPAAVTNASPSP